MKTTYLIVSILLSACTFSLDNNDKVDTSGKEYNSAYVCPMHCNGSGSDSAGVCPVCNMNYKQNPDYKINEKNGLEAEYSCPMHSEIVGVKGDSCSVCSMALEPTIKNQ